MRDPKRIEPMLDLLNDMRAKYPDLRLAGRPLGNAKR